MRMCGGGPLITFAGSFALGILFMHCSSLKPALFLSALLLFLICLRFSGCR